MKRETNLRYTDEQCWNAVLGRDAAFDSHFYFGVLTTGIFCRPACPARRPKRENVRFYPTTVEAERDGLRACKRCRPTERDADVAAMQALCDFIHQQCDAGEPVPLSRLAERAGLRPATLRQRFRTRVGVTPRQYVEAYRFGTLKEQLRDGTPVTDAIYDAGFASSSRVYEQADARLGMTPTTYQDGARGVDVAFASAETPVGHLVVAGTDRGLCFVELGNDPEPLIGKLYREFPHATITRVDSAGSPALRAWLEALRRHLAGQQPNLTLPLDIRGTAFQQQVWQYLQTIPFGETRSYTEVAQGVGNPKAVRAVASACAANPVALAIPCHRVLRANGQVGGYRWGPDRKAQLLTREKATIAASGTASSTASTTG